jgi:cyclase
MGEWKFEKGLEDLGAGVYAYIQPDGSWGWNNAGLVVDGDKSLLIDTLFDLKLTQEMLDTMSAAVPAAKTIDTLFITHANGDHHYGSQLVEGAEIICTKACAEELDETPPELLAGMVKGASDMGDLGKYVTHCFSAFDFEGITPLKPTRTFEKRLDIKCGATEVQLIEVGPTHTIGDAIVFIPEAKAVFAADILFIGGTPIMWIGPVENWINACDLMLDLDADKFVPGHGPITDKAGVEKFKGYWTYVRAEAKKRFEDGLSVADAIESIDLGEYASWGDSERIAVNVHTLFKQFSGDTTPDNTVELFGSMTSLWLKQSAQ